MENKKWSHKIYRMLQLWLTQIGHNRRIHHERSVKLSSMDDWFSIVIIVITGLSSIGSFINLSDLKPKAKFIISVIVGISSFVACVLTSINNKMKLGETSVLHKNMANEYSDLSNLIQTTVTLEQKPALNEFMKMITDRIEIINRYSPPLTGEQTSIADLPNYIMVKNSIKKKTDISIRESDIKLFLGESDTPLEVEKIDLDTTVDFGSDD